MALNINTNRIGQHQNFSHNDQAKQDLRKNSSSNLMFVQPQLNQNVNSQHQNFMMSGRESNQLSSRQNQQTSSKQRKSPAAQSQRNSSSLQKNGDYQNNNHGPKSVAKVSSTFTNLEATRLIGSGSFGYVFEAYDRDSNQTVAVKRTQKAGEYVSREFEVLSRLKDCKNVVRMLDIYYSRSEDGKTAQNLVFEFCKKNLEEVIQETKKKAAQLKELSKSNLQNSKNGGRIPIEDIKNYMKQILTGMAFVHKQKICHRDLKPENILMNEEGIVKICDFGSAKLLNESLNTPYIVSRYYRAPELILACSDYSEKIDIWAIGCIFAEFLTLRPLFPGKTEGSQLIEQIAILGLPSKDTMQRMSSQIQSQTIELVHKLDDIQRCDLRMILPSQDYQKKDIDECADLLSKMLQWVPADRITCEDALLHPFFKGVKFPA